MSEQYDIAIIGGGPGGYVAAIRAAQLKMKVVLIEKQHLGGICLNWGCIPTKALLRCSEIYHLIQRSAEFGISAKDVKFDIKKIVQRSRDVAGKLSSGIAHLMKKNNVTVIEGEGKISGSGKLTVKQNNKLLDINAKNIIIATGARARVLKGFEPDNKNIWTYREAMVPESAPKSLLVVGAGAIGVEFASFYNALGTKVILAESKDRILHVEDEEISKIATKSFSNQGIEVITGIKLISQKSHKDNITVVIEHAGKQREITVDKLIMAVGIVANTEELGLENTKVKLENGHIKTNDWLATDEAGIYAIGDVTTPPWLAHKASHEAIICVEKIANLPHLKPMKKNNIAGCTYSYPQIASVGLTEQEAIKLGHETKIGRFPFMANGKAIALGETEGLIKTIFDKKTGEFLGAHMIGAEVTELIQGFVIAKTLESTEEEIMHTIFPHPTLSEMMHESVLDAFGKAIHI